MNEMLKIDFLINPGHWATWGQIPQELNYHIHDIRHALNYHEKWWLPGLCIKFKGLNQLCGHSLFWHMRYAGTNLGHLFFATNYSRFLLFMRAGFKTSVPCTVGEKIRINYTDIKECNRFSHCTVPGVKTFETLWMWSLIK